jgi:protein disulfide-isomerase
MRLTALVRSVTIMARISTIGLALWAVLISARLGAAEGIAWRSDVETAQREAASTGRLVLLHFSGTFCPPCRVMEQTVFNRTDVAQAVEQHYVPVAVDIQKSPALSQHYNIRQIPADVIVTPTGQVLHKEVGGKSAQDYLATLARHVPPRPTPTGPFAPAAGGSIVQGRTDTRGTPPPPPSTPGAPPAPREAIGWQNPAPPLQGSPLAPRVGQQYPGETRTPQFQANSGANQTIGNNAGTSPPAPQTPPSWAGPPASGPPFGISPPAVPGGNHPLSPSAAQSPPPFGGSPQSRAPPSMPQPSAPQQNLPPVGFGGYCVVTMHHQQRWAAGDRRWGAIHDGRLYLFAAVEAQQAFLRDPHRYAPMLGGDDVVTFVETGKRIPGQVRVGATHTLPGDHPRLYLFESEQTLEKFSIVGNAAMYVERLRQMLANAR